MLASRPCEAIPIDLRHQAMCKMLSAKDRRFVPFIQALERMKTVLGDPELRKAYPKDPQRRTVSLLALDGGGVKGIFSVLILHAIMEEITIQSKGIKDAGEKARPCDYFDLIGGTSTGGLLAIMLGRLRMDTSSCLRTYGEMSKQIFDRYDGIPFIRPALTAASALMGVPWFSGPRLKAAICGTIEENLSSREKATVIRSDFRAEDVELLDGFEPSRSRCFVCAVPKGQRSAERIRSYRSIDPSANKTSNFKIWEAALATSAAPMYFPAISIQGQTYFDGGLDCNNPVIEVIREAETEFPGARVKAVVSVGTGMGKIEEPEPFLHNVFMSFVQRATDTEGKHEELMEDRRYEDLRAGYFRFQGDLRLGEIDLADAKRLEEIEKLAAQYLDSREGKALVQSCAARLLA